MAFARGRSIIYVLVVVVFLESSIAEKPPNYSFMHEATKAPKNSFYDYIVIGGGAAGIPIATTLSAKYSVLLLERGGSPYLNTNITSIFGYGNNFEDNSPDSPSQKFTSTEGVINTRARVLGGGTCINAGFYSRGEAQFNKEARLMDEKLIHESYEWVEKVMAFEPPEQKWPSAVRAALVETGVKPDNGFTYDHIVGTKVGGTIFDKNGTRHTAADLLQYANPKGLSVLLRATVHKILFKTKGRSRPLAYGIMFKDSKGNKHVAYLNGGKKDEIILSAGALGSPQLLMLSGIVEPSGVQIVGITRFGSYIEAVGGFNFVYTKSPNYQGYSPQMGGFIFEKVNGPLSTGEVKIENCNPAENPSVTFNYFKEPKDLRKCVEGVRTILKAVESKAFSNYTYANMTVQDIININMKLPGDVVSSNKSPSLEQYCKDTKRTIWHYHGGCRIGKVVDYEYKVVGLDAIRVIDGSTILNSPGTNPQASVLMLGRYMGLTILGQRVADDKSQ
uniref:Protein HOTHEAD-like n=1 Tax=Tanacetum cinerariifolium TaxID=118510 RepID=A0A699HT12_TANCI|nr:protein HOTHEAD-like [Tanacetum cinerariifolium]